MRTFRCAGVLACIAVSTALPLRAAPYVWTGVPPTDWQGNLTPPNDGTADLFLGKALNNTVTLSTSLNLVNTVSINNGENFDVKSAGPLTLTLMGGILGDTSFGALQFESNVNLGVTGTGAVFEAGSNSVIVLGQVTGSANVAFLSAAGGNGSFILANTAAGNTYVGSSVVGDGATGDPTIAFWNSSPFGTGTVTFMNGGFLIAHGTQTVANNLVFNAFASTQSVRLKSWDAPLTFSGAVTLANNTFLYARQATFALPAPTGTGSIPEPGPFSLNPIVFSGVVSGAHQLSVDGPGAIVLTGANTYSGGTSIGGSGSGSLVFGSAAAIPAGAGNVVVGTGGYAGTADTTVGAFSALLGHVNSSSTGSVGVDTLPGNAISTINDTINLTGFGSPLSVGTATSAIIGAASTLIPKSNSHFLFGGGGGTLYVDEPLANIGVNTDLTLSTPSGSDNPMTLYLRGANTYLGGTTSQNGVLIFDGAGSIPGSGQLVAAGSSLSPGASYVGFTDLALTTPAAFLSLFNTASTWGIVGLDSSNVSTPVTITTPVNLSTFNNGVFLGTATAAIIGSGSVLTPTADNTLRLTAASSGKLTVNPVLSGSMSLIVGSPSQFGPYSSGTVVINGANSFSGGTRLNADNGAGITLGAGSSTALGTGTLTIGSAHGGGLAGLEATTPSITLANPVVFENAGTGAADLYFTGTQNFGLSGPITGDNTSNITLYTSAPIAVTLSGNNSGFAGTFNVFNGQLNLPTNTSAGAGIFYLAGSTATVDFTGAAAPTISSLKGIYGNIFLQNGATFTVDTTNDVTSNTGFDFGGVIAGPGDTLTTASLLVKNTAPMSQNSAVYLYGNNLYSGGTTITNNGVLALGNPNAAGTGPVTLASSAAGGFALNTGVTFTNVLNFTSGNLLGFGTFSPSNLPTVTFGTNQAVIAGIPGFGHKGVTGILSFGNNVNFANGGGYLWSLQDTSRPDGQSQLNIAGNLTVSATAGGFGLELLSFDATGAPNNAANFNVNAPYTWIIAKTGGTIMGFSPADFTIYTSTFQNGTLSAANFTLSLNGGNNQLLLNFTPVPEPSTYALLAVGLGIVACAAWRRRAL